MNSVTITGKLTRNPFLADKGYAAATLAIPKAGSSYAVWVSLYAPKGSAADAFRGFKEGDEIEVKGELDEGKDKDGNKKLQVKVLSARILTAQRPNGRGSEYIDDQDFSF